MKINKKIGLMLPSSNTVMEPDFYRNIPGHYTLHTARMYLKDVTAESEAEMLDDYALPAARDLATADVDVVVFGCTSAGALRGNVYEAQLMKEISSITGKPTVSVIHSVRNALKTVQARRIVVITPYVDELNVKIRASLMDDGLDVLHIEGLGIDDNPSIARVAGDRIEKLAEEAVSGLSPDALFLSCTNFPAVSMLPLLREKYPFDVFSSNQAALQAAMEYIKKDE